MKTKKIFKALAMVLLLPAMLLTTACSNDDDAVNNDNTAKKGYPLQVTINVTRQGDEGTTRATYNESTRKLEFSAGDQLFVWGEDNNAGTFAGTLTWTSGGTFSGTIYTKKDYSGTPKKLLDESVATAVLLPAGYNTYGFLTIQNPGTYGAYLDMNYNKAFATSKATAVEQFSLEYAASEYSYSSETGFALSPLNAILNFTITGLTPSTEVTATLTYARLTLMISENVTISEKVTTDVSGNATFAVGIDVTQNYYPSDLSNLTLTVGGNEINLGSKTLEAGHIYNVKRAIDALPGKFTISNDNGTTTRQVFFSKGNLRANYNTSWSWSFFPNQWDYVGNASNNNNITGNGTVGTGSDYLYVDLFGWSTASTYYGIHNSQSHTNYLGDFVDWGNAIGSVWRTLTADEWNYLFTGRTTGGTVGSTSRARYTMATIRTDVSSGLYGIILFPDGVDIANTTDFFTTLSRVNNTCDFSTKCTSAQWSALENKGCVFLPVAGVRDGTSVYSFSRYWSSSPYDGNPGAAYCVSLGNPPVIMSTGLDLEDRNYGLSVRLVRAVE